MDRITNADLDVMLARYVRALEALELPSGDITLTRGSKLYGNSYKALQKGGTHPVGIAGGFLGWTKRDAHDKLYTVAVTLEDVHYERGNL